MIPYDSSHDPPAIVLSINVAGGVHRRPIVNVPALIDTGADVTADSILTAALSQAESDIMSVTRAQEIVITEAREGQQNVEENGRVTITIG